MRPASSRVVTLSITVVCLLATFLSLNGLASAQAGSKDKLSKSAVSSQRPAAGAVKDAGGTPKLTSDTWTGTAGDGNWGTTNNWSAGVPNSGDAVTIGGASTAVNLNVAGSAGTLTLNSGDSLNIVNGDSLTMSGNIANSGSMTMSSSNGATQLIVGVSGITLSGTGTLSMSNNGNNTILGSVGADTLTNSSTIQGTGNIGDNQMTLVNSTGGIIDATQSGPLYIQTSGGTTNTGLLEATTGTLVLNGNTVTNTGGTIEATGSDVELENGVTITGGTLTTTGSGVIFSNNSATLQNLTNSGNYQVVNGTNTTLVGTITNNGNINLTSSNGGTYLEMSSNVSLNGTGTLTMSSNGNNFIFDTTAGGVLTIGSGQTVSGGGDIGYDPLVSASQLTLTNNGIIDATQPTALYIQTSGGTTNTGTLEATAGGTLNLDGSTVTNTGAGTIQANGVSGNNAVVNLENGVTITGGTFTNNANGVIEVANTATLSGTTISSGSTMNVLNGSALTLVGTTTNNGTIALESVNGGTDLILSGNVSLAGTGGVTMSNNGNNIIEGGVATDVLTVGSNQVISGSGNIGNNSMALVNNGVINATQSTQLYIDTSNGTTNNATLEATGGGTLTLYGQTGNVLTNNGTISAAASSTVLLQNGIVVSGGTLTTSGGGLIQTQGGQTSTLENITNTGNYQIDNGGVTIAVGTITNTGNINMASANGGTYLELSGNVTLNGAGTLTMSNNGNNYITGASGMGTEVLTNNSTISGSGNIGQAEMILDNTSLGTIDATQSTQLQIDPSAGGVTNTGLIEATSGGNLALDSGTYTNAVGSTQGTILANGGTVNLNNGADIVGGTLKSENSGLIQTTATSTLDGSTSAGAVTIAAGSSLVVNNGTALDLKGSITNNGTVSLASGNGGTYLEVTNTSATLSGSGTVTMSNNGNNGIYAAAGTDTFTNKETIQGSGNIGIGSLTFVNQGTVNANQTTPLTIQTSNGTTNTGTLEATTTGTLVLNGNTITNTGGTIQANGATGSGNGAAVNLENGVAITGGTITSNQFGAINVENSATLSGLTTSGTVNIQNGTALTLVGTIVNNGTLNLQSANGGTDLIMSGNVSLNGSGSVNMSNNGNNYIYGAVGTDVLTVASTQTIQGGGNIGDNQMVLVNNGTIDATQPATLYIQASGGTTNTGTLEATGGGTLSLYGYSVTNTGAGKIVAGSGSTVLLNGAIVNGGSLTGSGDYVVNGANGAPTLNGLTNSSTVVIDNGTALTLEGTIVNNGQIQENSANGTTEITLNGNVALNGTGTILMSNNGNNYIFGQSGSDVLTVASTQTISGGGNIGDGQMVLVNNGTIDANVPAQLYIETSGGTTNTGTLEATSGGTLTLNGNTVTNTGAGTIVAGSGSTVNLEGSVTVKGGSLTGGGSFVVGNGGTPTLDGLTNSSTVVVVNGNSLVLEGTIVNNGQIQENSANGTTEITLNGNVTLSGSGTLVMSSNGSNYIFGQSGSDILTNDSTIEGGGHLGDAQMTLVNSGTIDANVGTTLAISVSGTVDNKGTFESTSSGGLTVTAPTGSFLNYTSSNNTLTGGSYVANGGNIYLPLGSSGGIATLAASVTEENGGQIFNSNDGNANALNGLTSITSAGALTIGGVAFTDTGSFSNAGSLTILAGESFDVATLTQISGTTLTAGTYV
ncbi:MAG: hypothetical protein ABSA78_02385, partial [Candidatus Sulfotelmatobacter sp.]